MVKATIELCPGGDEEHAQHLGTAIISNDLTETLNSGGELGNYKVRLSKWGRPKEIWKRGEVTGFNRKTRGPYDLLFLALLNTVGRRHKRAIKAFMDQNG